MLSVVRNVSNIGTCKFVTLLQEERAEGMWLGKAQSGRRQEWSQDPFTTILSYAES